MKENMLLKQKLYETTKQVLHKQDSDLYHDGILKIMNDYQLIILWLQSEIKQL